VRLTKADHNVLQSKIAHSLAQALQILGDDVFCDDAALGSDNRRQPYDVVAATRADVRDSHPGFDAKQPYELARFAGVVALLFIVPDRTDDVRDRAIGFRKATAGAPDCAMRFCAAPEMVNAAAKTTPIVIRIMR
jgi:hypothetical protein